MYLLASAFSNGRGRGPGLGPGSSMVPKAAALGQASAMHCLGVAYSQGYGVARDPVKALQWFCQAAENGDEESRDMFRQLSGSEGNDTKQEKE